MSSSTDNLEQAIIPKIPSGWTSAGTARSRFSEELTDASLKKQIAEFSLTESLQRMRKQFAEIQLGSEYFFQALDFLNWSEGSKTKSSVEQNLRFHVLLSGLLLMRKAVISGSTCLPWKVLETGINTILLNSGFFANQLSQQEWQKWLLTSFGTETESDLPADENSIFTENNSLLYFSKNWQSESLLLALLRKRINMNLDVPEISQVEKVLESVLVDHPVRFGDKNLKLADEQKDAVLNAISKPLLIITGGPGTGKTSVAVTLLRVLKRLGLAERPALAAPTGRAAKRMSESVLNSLISLENLKQLTLDQELIEVAAEAKTLHRLLGYSPVTHSFKHHEYDPLEHDLLIIDEGSMIDQEMMTSLLRAVDSKLPYRPSVPRIVLLGDAHQLPSVGNGAVLQELTADLSGLQHENVIENPVPVTRLLRSYRQEIGDSAGRNILGVAETVKAMEHNPRPELLFEASSQNHEIIRKLKNLDDIEHEKVLFLEQTNTSEQLKDFANWWVKNFLQDERFLLEVQNEFPGDATETHSANLNYLFEHLKHFRVLTVTQVLSTGSTAVNQHIRECWLAENETKFLISDHYPGEPVMVTENNYKLQLFNGDQGIFLNFINPDSATVELKAVFSVDGVFKTFYEYELHHLQSAYAITVHKSQGSEYDHLALILPTLSKEEVDAEPESRRIYELMNRELLYTALTRAKKSVLILGEQNVLESAALHKISRYSGLGVALRSNTDL